MEYVIRLMADYYCWPLWWMNGDGDIDPHTLPLSPETIERLVRWSDTYDSVLNIADPASSMWPSIEAHEAFYQEGYELWLVVRRELEGSYKVFYQEGGRVFYEPSDYSRAASQE
jgi:hypothetical protein